MKNKKDLLAIVGLLILATIFSFSSLNFKPKTALSQTSSSDKYTTFYTENLGFKFLNQSGYAPLFAATPDENSPGNQVVTKEYIEKYPVVSGLAFGYKLTKYSQKDANLVCNPKDTQTFYVNKNQCQSDNRGSYVASGTVINAVVDPKTKGMNCWDRYWGMERSENKEETFTYFNNDLIKYEVTILQGAIWESYPGEIVWWRDYTDWCGVVDVTEPINKLCQNGCVISFTRQGGVQETQGYYSSANDLKRGNCQDSICAYKDVVGWPQTPCVLKWKVNTNEFYIQDYSGRYRNTGFCGMIIRKL
jgi:hypothetical protein